MPRRPDWYEIGAVPIEGSYAEREPVGPAQKMWCWRNKTAKVPIKTGNYRLCIRGAPSEDTPKPVYMVWFPGESDTMRGPPKGKARNGMSRGRSGRPKDDKGRFVPMGRGDSGKT